ncbi:MAG: hypothetical protein WBQ50_15430, partial [Nocardioides sp.]
MQTQTRGWRNHPWHLILPVCVYLVLTLAGASYSSIGIGELREDPESVEGVMLGSARPIRSDEWLTGTPVNLRALATGQTEDKNPLTASEALLSALPTGPVTSTLLLDGSLMRLGPWLPDSILYSARLWLPFLLLAIGAPAWFRFMTGSRWIGWFAATLVVVSPVSAWWSFIPVGILGPTFAGAAALVLAARATKESRLPSALGWGLLSVLMLARTPFTYQPWAIVLVPAVLLVTTLVLAGPRKGRRRVLLTIAAIGLGTILTFLAALYENREAIAAVSGTVYPGSRASTGAPNPLQQIFGASSLHVLVGDPPLTGPNQSELSSSYTVFFVWCALLLVAAGRWRTRGQRAGIYGLLAVSGIWLAWCTVAMGTIGSSIPLLNIVPSVRAAQIVGILGVLALCLVLPRAADRGPL